MPNNRSNLWPSIARKFEMNDPCWVFTTKQQLENELNCDIDDAVLREVVGAKPAHGGWLCPGAPRGFDMSLTDPVERLKDRFPKMYLLNFLSRHRVPMSHILRNLYMDWEGFSPDELRGIGRALCRFSIYTQSRLERAERMFIVSDTYQPHRDLREIAAAILGAYSTSLHRPTIDELMVARGRLPPMEQADYLFERRSLITCLEATGAGRVDSDDNVWLPWHDAPVQR